MALETALGLLHGTLTTSQWPAKAMSDIGMLEADGGSLLGDLQDLATLNLKDASGWEAMFQRDATMESTAVALVGHDLALPGPPPVTSVGSSTAVVQSSACVSTAGGTSVSVPCPTG
jgi:hypothetical protein